MTNDTQTPALVLKDQEGNYILLPQQVLEQGRVPEEHKAEVDRLLAESDVSGFFGIIAGFIAVKLIAVGVAAVGTGIAKGAAESVEEVYILEGIESPKPQ